MLKAAAETLRTPPPDIPARLSQLLDDHKRLEKEVSDLRRQLALGSGTSPKPQDAPREINGIKLISRILSDCPAKDLKPMADAFKSQIQSGVVALVADFEGKVSVVVAVTNDLTGAISAVDLVKVAAAQVGGTGGGGRADMAQAGGSNAVAMPQAITAIERALENRARAV
jgi:alanyl-tRNA synthetase